LSIASEEAPKESEVSDRGTATSPADRRCRFDIEAGDKVCRDIDGSAFSERN